MSTYGCLSMVPRISLTFAPGMSKPTHTTSQFIPADCVSHLYYCLWFRDDDVWLYPLRWDLWSSHHIRTKVQHRNAMPTYLYQTNYSIQIYICLLLMIPNNKGLANVCLGSNQGNVTEDSYTMQYTMFVYGDGDCYKITFVVTKIKFKIISSVWKLSYHVGG